MILKEYMTKSGEVLLYNGDPRFLLLDSLSEGPGDLWHSSLDQGFQNCFPELIYQTAVFWWFLNDFENLECSINWRINPNSFVVRKRVWEIFEGFPSGYDNDVTAALDLGFRLLRYGGGVPLYIKDLFEAQNNDIKISAEDRYVFFMKNFKPRHSRYMLVKAGLNNPTREWKAFKAAKLKKPKFNNFPVIPPRTLEHLHGKPTVSVIIPTMYRQKYTLQLLHDYQEQDYLVKEVIVIDATPEEERDTEVYKKANFSFKLVVKWQQSNGSCKARNEAINLCTGDFIIFADDDTRIPPNFVGNHLRFLKTYKAAACNGLDIQAKNHNHGLTELFQALDSLGNKRWKAGASQNFSNANSCVRKKWVDTLIGNDINFDGGYGEDSDFGYRILKEGGIVLSNPYSVNLHLKPPSGGYRHWHIQSSILGKRRKKQAWEHDYPVKFIKPAPSPTVLYGIVKHFWPIQVKEYRSKYFFIYLFNKPKKSFLLRLLKLPWKYIQFNRSLFYAKNLVKQGERY